MWLPPKEILRRNYGNVNGADLDRPEVQQETSANTIRQGGGFGSQQGLLYFSRMGKSFLFWSRFKRMGLSALAGVAVMIPIVGVILSKYFQSVTLENIWTSWWFIGSVLVSLLLLILRWYFAYRKLTYDPTWVLKYQDVWDGMEEKRDLAARALRDYRGKLKTLQELAAELEDIDPVLDFISDIGFYSQGDQISPEVAWSHFYHWVRGYWIAAREYVLECQKKEPKRWREIEPLFDTLLTIEVGRGRKARENEILMAVNDTDDFLKSEFISDDRKSKKSGAPLTGRNK